MNKLRRLARRVFSGATLESASSNNGEAVSWEALSAALLRFARQESHLEQMANLLAQVLPVYVKEPHAQKFFRVWERCGVHLTPVHFYQPIPDTGALDDALWSRPSETVGIDWNEAAQIELLSNAFPRFEAEYDQLPASPTARPHEFHFNNGAFDWTDALVYYCMVRHFRPGSIVEVGSGFSTRLAARAVLLNGNTRLTAVEPYPDPVLKRGFAGLTSLVEKQVQDVGLELFGQLTSGDILFIDSSHVVKCGGDVNYLFLEVIPRLKPGVIVHVHDIFLPEELPRDWIKELRLFWTEQYLLQAFLAFNSEFEVLFANAYMGLRHKEKMRATFPKSKWWGGGSFWMRRKHNVSR